MTTIHDLTRMAEEKTDVMANENPLPDEPADWRDRSACRSLDPDLFFPGIGETAKTAKALKVCATCPVRTDCLEYALDTEQRFGIWGGLVGRQLTRERTRRRRQAQRAS